MCVTIRNSMHGVLIQRELIQGPFTCEIIKNIRRKALVELATFTVELRATWEIVELNKIPKPEIKLTEVQSHGPNSSHFALINAFELVVVIINES